jgi:hypothetical protein
VVGHVEGMEGMGNVALKTDGMRSLGDRSRWEDNIKIDLRQMVCVCVRTAQNEVQQDVG